MITSNHLGRFGLAVLLAPIAWSTVSAQTLAGQNYQIFVSNEKSGDVTVIDASDSKVVATIPVGKRPRGIQVSPDGATVYVAMSGTPIAPPPKLDAQGNPIFQRGKDDDDDDTAHADKSADGIGVINVAQRKLTGKLNVGSDPEEFSLSKSGTELYISNEDVKAASVIDIASGKVTHIIPVGQEPEGVGTAPDGKTFYVTCESGGEIYVIDTTTYKTIGHFTVPPRPRSIDFLPGKGIGFIPSESTGLLNVIDTVHYAVLKAVTLPPGSRPVRVRVAPNGQKIYVSNGRAGTVSVLDSNSYALVDSIKVGTRPWGLVISPDGKYLYSANGPSNDVSVVDLQTDKEIARIPAGQSPWGIVIVPNQR
jgi:YVTN family beta-propeller protein